MEQGCCQKHFLPSHWEVLFLHTSVTSPLVKISQYSSLKLSLFPINEDWCRQVYCSCETLLNCTLHATSVVAHYKYKDDSIKYLSLWECSG